VTTSHSSTELVTRANKYFSGGRIYLVRWTKLINKDSNISIILNK
jgi:hypothetical protein